MTTCINNTYLYEFPWGKGVLYFNLDDELVEIKMFLSSTSGISSNMASTNSTKLISELDDYFVGKKVLFSVPLNLNNCTNYQKQVYEVLRERVKYGETITYQGLSKLAGGSPRSVGQAMKRNPIAIVIPCHRVLSSIGLGGFYGGLEMKKYLLSLERR